VASNWAEEEKSGPEVVWWHNGRANAENYNKEVKIGFHLESLPCGTYLANAVWFGMGILAYQLFIASKLYLFPAGWLKKTVGTVRWQLIQVAGKVIRHARQVVLRLCGIGGELFEVYQGALERCWELRTVF